jgi:surface polysaccharide O-acyltransferase-like enzyme
MMVGSHQSINIGKALLSVFEGKSFAHLWYLYVLIGIYLTLPVFKAFINSASRETIEVLLLVLFVFDFIASMASIW